MVNKKRMALEQTLIKKEGLEYVVAVNLEDAENIFLSDEIRTKAIQSVYTQVAKVENKYGYELLETRRLLNIYEAQIREGVIGDK